MKINKGVLWLGMEWEKAIKETIIIMNENKLKGFTCGFVRIEKIIKDKNPNKLLCNEKVFVGYRFICDEYKTYKTSIPKKYNSLIENEKEGLKE